MHDSARAKNAFSDGTLEIDQTMKRRFTLVLLLVASILIATGCSSESSEPGTNTEEAAATANSNSLSVVPENGDSAAKLVPYNGVPNTNSNPTLGNQKVEVIDTTKLKPAPMTKVLPENSELATYMDKTGRVIETRTFKSDRQLNKVEKITRTPSDTTTKVFLKNGKVIEIPEGKLADFRTASIASILEAAGVASPAATTQTGGNQGVKKDEGTRRNED